MDHVATHIATESQPLVFALVAICAGLLLGVIHLNRRLQRTRASRKRYSDAVDHMAEGLYRSTIDGKQIKANPALVKLNGYDSEAELLACVNDIAKEWYVQPGRRDEFKEAIERDGSVQNFVSEVYRHKTRERIWISENARIVYDEKTGKPCYYEGSVRDITSEIDSRDLREKLEKLSLNLPGGLFQLLRKPDGSFFTQYMSKGFLELVGVKHPDDVRNPNDYLGNIHPDDLPAYLEALGQSAEELGQWRSEFRYQRRSGAYAWLEVTATPERLKDGSIIWHGHLNDASARKEAEARVEKMAYVDPLTELPNRRLFTERLKKTIGVCGRSQEHCAVLFLDLDNFKSLNDTHGHDFGDELLRQVAGRLSACIRPGDTVSRFGGDEFVLLLENLDTDRQGAVTGASAAAAKILNEFGTGFDLFGVAHVITPSIGVVVFDGKSREAEEILKSADIAMFEAKKSGRNSYVLFDPSGLKDVSEQFGLQRDLSGAIRNNQLVLHFQPQVDAAGRIMGAEALVRWKHPRLGLLSPGAFVPMAERTGLITDINDWVLGQAIETLARWQEAPQLRGKTLSVNLSVQQFRSDKFVAGFSRQIHDAGIDPRLLTLELTEHVMARNPEQVAASMNELKGLGIKFSLDDFGTGYSSLSQLNRFPFDEVKIDGSFIQDIDRRKSNRALVEAILGMANAFDLTTVAEHVSSATQIKFLRERGCDLYQGFYFHAPQDENRFTALVVEQAGNKAA